MDPKMTKGPAAEATGPPSRFPLAWSPSMCSSRCYPGQLSRAGLGGSKVPSAASPDEGTSRTSRSRTASVRPVPRLLEWQVSLSTNPPPNQPELPRNLTTRLLSNLTLRRVASPREVPGGSPAAGPLFLGRFLGHPGSPGSARQGLVCHGPQTKSTTFFREVIFFSEGRNRSVARAPTT